MCQPRCIARFCLCVPPKPETQVSVLNALAKKLFQITISFQNHENLLQGVSKKLAEIYITATANEHSSACRCATYYARRI